MTVADIIAKGNRWWPSGTALAYHGEKREYTAPEYYIVAWPGFRTAILLSLEVPEGFRGNGKVHTLERWEEAVQTKENLSLTPQELHQLIGLEEDPADWDVVTYELNFTPLA